MRQLRLAASKRIAAQGALGALEAVGAAAAAAPPPPPPGARRGLAALERAIGADEKRLAKDKVHLLLARSRTTKDRAGDAQRRLHLLDRRRPGEPPDSDATRAGGVCGGAAAAAGAAGAALLEGGGGE